MILKEIYEEKINDSEVISEVSSIANNDREISSMGLGVTTIRIVAIATLRGLGNSKIFDELSENEKNLVRGAFT